MATTDKISAIKQTLISHHTQLIEQLETKYMDYIVKLLQQKRQIIRQMQKQFSNELLNLDKQYLAKANGETSIIPNQRNSKINTTKLPYLECNQNNIIPSLLR